MEDAYALYAGRREALIRALTVDVRKVRKKCWENGVNDGQYFCLYGDPKGTWEIKSPPQPPSNEATPYPFTLNNEQPLKGLTREWIEFIAEHSNAWLMSSVSLDVVRFGLNRRQRGLLYEKISSLSRVSQEVANYYNTKCGICGVLYEENDYFWVLCDICQKWFHGDCLNVSPDVARENNVYCCVCKPGKSVSSEKDVCGNCKVLYKSDGYFWVRCHRCKTRFHGHCVNVFGENAENIRKYYCPLCEPPNGKIRRKKHGSTSKQKK